MSLFRRLVVLTLGLAALSAVGSSGALAAGPPPPDCSNPPSFAQQISSSHFVVLYNDDPNASGFITQIQAGTELAAAERNYASFVGTGFPAPAVDSSGKTELYVMDLSQFNLAAEYCNGSVFENSATVTGAGMPFAVGNDVFAEVGLSIGVNAPTWLLNGASAWASWRALGYPAESISDIGPFDMALDCASQYDKVNCSTHPYENDGSSRWPFYEYLTEKYGPLFIINIFSATNAVAGDGLLGLQNALIAKGTTLSAEYSSYAAKLLTGGWTATTLSAAVIPVSGTPIPTGISSGAIPTQTFGINHLATKFVEIDRGDGDGSHPCYAATLTLNVQIPAGVTTQPTFYWSGGGSAPVTLSVSGNTATTTVPWDTCAWTTKGYLALPNTSLVDGMSFTVSGTLSVDFLNPATAALPPAPSTQFGQVFPASSYSTAPTLSLFGPELIQLGAQDSQLRLIVESSGEGSVTAAIGSVTLGTYPVRPGGNDLRVPLPASLLQTMRRTASADNPVLTLTPTSLDGKTTGVAVTRKVSITPATRAAKKSGAKKPAAKKPSAKKKTVKRPIKSSAKK
jgi:hypothetical protein